MFDFMIAARIMVFAAVKTSYADFYDGRGEINMMQHAAIEGLCERQDDIECR